MVLKGIRIWGMVMLKVLAPDLPASKLLFKADDKRKLAVICLCSSLDPLPFFFFEFAAIFCDFFVVDTVKIYTNDLSILCFG